MDSKSTKVVVALGGNALQEAGSPATAEAQLEVVRKTCEYLADISTQGYEMAVVHGNGPQVGRIVLGQDLAAMCRGILRIFVATIHTGENSFVHVVFSSNHSVRLMRPPSDSRRGSPESCSGTG